MPLVLYTKKVMLQKISGLLFSGYTIARARHKTIAKAFVFGLSAAGINFQEAKDNIAPQNAKESMKYACLLNVNAASSMLTSFMCCVEDTSQKYNNTVMKLISKLDECLLLNGWNDELWETVIALRNEMNSLKTELLHLTSLTESINKVVTSTIELSFAIDASSLCTTLCEHNHLAEEKLAKIKKEVKYKEEMYLTVQAEVAKNYKNLDT